MIRVEILEYTKDGERLVALAAKRSMSSQAVLKVNDEEVEKILIETYRKGHWSPWEFSNYVFEVVCSRVCTHQLVRHRIASYLQLSQRYGLALLKDFLNDVGGKVGRICNVSDYTCHAFNVEEIVKKFAEAPNVVEEDMLFSLIGNYFYVPNAVKQNRELYRDYIMFILDSIKLYLILLSYGIPYEDARYILPQSVKSRIIVQMNARELATSFFPLRMCSRTQKELRMVAWKLWLKLENIHPRLFSYVGPRCLMMENSIREQPIKLRDILDPECKAEFTIPRCLEGVNKDSIKTCVVNTYRYTLDL